MDESFDQREQVFELGRAAEGLERMRRRAAYEHETGDTCGVPSIGLERDLHAHRVADEDRLIDLGVIEDARDVIGEIFDRDATRVSGRGGAPVASIMRMQPESLGEVLAQVPPNVAV